MNYGDKMDLKRLYESVWMGQLKQINGTEIRLVRAYHLQSPAVVAAATAIVA